ncbi:MAG: alcohol dehydrogenase [Planctomycetaceae bacterium]|nr:alcohol dehydrogenase [Planctomycetaceae bacterium]
MLSSIQAFDLLVPSRLLFGWGRRCELPSMAPLLGSRCFAIVGSQTLLREGLFAEIRSLINTASNVAEPPQIISREPLVEDVDQAVLRARECGADFILGIGGGAAIDLAKAVAAIAPQDEAYSVIDYLEGVRRELPLVQPSLQTLVMPTTAGTGSEATRNAVISSVAPRYKKSLRAASMMPDIALVDPELTVTTPPEITLHSGMDALTQCIESYLSCRASSFTRPLALEGFHHAWTALPIVMREPSSRPAREAMSFAALLSGISLTNSGLGMAHGVAAALGVHAQIPHGLACAAMLPVALQTNLECSRPRLQQLDVARRGPFVSEPGSAEALIEAVISLCQRTGIPQRLRELGVSVDQLNAIVTSSSRNSMRANPRPIEDPELLEILSRAW